MKLDRSKPYFTVHGNQTNAYFEQDGKVFDCNGEPLDSADPLVDSQTATAGGTQTDEKPAREKKPATTSGSAKKPKAAKAAVATVSTPSSEIDQQLAAQK